MYPAASDQPRAVFVTTSNEGPTPKSIRYPHVEAKFNPSLQPYIHNCIVNVIAGGTLARFAVFYKQHCRLPPNHSLRKGNLAFRGDILVMRVASKNVNSYVNMRGGDIALSDFVVAW